MAAPIASMIVTASMQKAIQAVYLKDFIEEVTIDLSIYERYAKKMTLPNSMGGDTSVTGDTGGDLARSYGLYEGYDDGFKISGWDSQAYYMNWGETVDGINDADYTTDGGLDNNFSDYEIAEGTSYNSGTDYNYHNKALTNKFYINVPIVRFGATNQYDSLGDLLTAGEDSRELIKQFGQQAAMVQAQYIRATLINMATIDSEGLTFTNGGTDIEGTAAVTKLNSLKQILKRKGAKVFTTATKPSDGVGTTPVRQGYIAIINSEMENAIQDLPGFVHVSQYPSGQPAFEGEFGTVPETEIRFVTNNVIVRQSGTSAITNVDVYTPANGLTTYNMLVFGKDAYTVATVSGADKYKLFVDAPGKGADTLRNEKRMGWKSIMGCAVTRSAWIYNIPITFATV